MCHGRYTVMCNGGHGVKCIVKYDGEGVMKQMENSIHINIHTPYPSYLFTYKSLYRTYYIYITTCHTVDTYLASIELLS